MILLKKDGLLTRIVLRKNDWLDTTIFLLGFVTSTQPTIRSLILLDFGWAAQRATPQGLY